MSDDEYVCTLTEGGLRKARDELREDPDQRLGAVKTLREWTEREQWITSPTANRFLLPFLRCGKFSQLDARDRMCKYLGTMSGSYSFMTGHDPIHPDSLEIIRRGYMFVLPGRDKHGCATLVLRPQVVDTSGPYTHKDYTRAVHPLLDSLLFFDESIQVSGVNSLVDFGNVSMNLLTWVGVDGMKSTAEITSHSYPVRFKYVDYYDVGPVFEAFMALFKPLLSKKMQNRITLHHTMVSVYEKIEMSRLPVEYLPDDYTGPSAGTIKDIAGDSNLKFVERFVSYQDRDKVKVLSLPGASIVDDKTGFSRSLHRHIVVYKPDTICLHLGSNDADRGKTSLVYRELGYLLDGIISKSPNCRVILCSVLPRTQNSFKGELWNRNILPRIQADVQTVNAVFKQTCEERKIQCLEYHMPAEHIGWDGLHVRPPGAKYLLSEVSAKLISKG